MSHSSTCVLCFSRLKAFLLGLGLCLSLCSPALAQATHKVGIETNLGTIELELYGNAAPKTVANFLRYVDEGHYNNTIFHRVIPKFMIQGGGYSASFDEKPNHAPVEHEGRKALAAGLNNRLGSIAMARTSNPQSATAQFFINVNDNNFLDPTPIPPGDPVPEFVYQGRTYRNLPREQLLAATQLYGYTVFGHVVSGMDIVQKIALTPTSGAGPFPTDVPRQTITILRAFRLK